MQVGVAAYDIEIAIMHAHGKLAAEQPDISEARAYAGIRCPTWLIRVVERDGKDSVAKLAANFTPTVRWCVNVHVDVAIDEIGNLSAGESDRSDKNTLGAERPPMKRRQIHDHSGIAGCGSGAMEMRKAGGTRQVSI